MSGFDPVGRELLRELAEKQAAAYAQMLVYDEGIGGLAVRRPEMAEDMHRWLEATDNDHADSVLVALDAIDRVLALHAPTGRVIDGREWCGHCTHLHPCPTVRAIGGTP